MFTVTKWLLLLLELWICESHTSNWTLACWSMFSLTLPSAAVTPGTRPARRASTSASSPHHTASCSSTHQPLAFGPSWMASQTPLSQMYLQAFINGADGHETVDRQWRWVLLGTEHNEWVLLHSTFSASNIVDTRCAAINKPPCDQASHNRFS